MQQYDHSPLVFCSCHHTQILTACQHCGTDMFGKLIKLRHGAKNVCSQHANDIINTAINLQITKYMRRLMKLCFLLIASYYIVMMFGCVYCTRELKLDFEFQFFNIANTIAFPRKHVRWNHVLSFNFGIFAIISLALRQKNDDY